MRDEVIEAALEALLLSSSETEPVGFSLHRWKMQLTNDLFVPTVAEKAAIAMGKSLSWQVMPLNEKAARYHSFRQHGLGGVTVPTYRHIYVKTENDHNVLPGISKPQVFLHTMFHELGHAYIRDVFSDIWDNKPIEERIQEEIIVEIAAVANQKVLFGVSQDPSAIAHIAGTMRDALMRDVDLPYTLIDEAARVAEGCYPIIKEALDKHGIATR